MTALAYGVDARVDMLRPDNHFILDHDHLDVDPLGHLPDWVEVSCDVVELSSSRGDVLAVDQRPNAKLDVGTLSVTVLDRAGAWIPDDMARLLGLPETGLKPGTPIRVMAGTAAFGYRCIFYGTVTDYRGEWLETGEHLITLSAVDPVAAIASVNPAALATAVGDYDSIKPRFDRLAALTVGLECRLAATYSTIADFRMDTFGDPLIEQWQKFGDTELLHLAVRVPSNVVPYLYAKPCGRADVAEPWAANLTDCLLPLGPNLTDIPMHWGELTVSTAGIVNDVLASADRSGTDRYLAKFSAYPGTGYYGWGKLEIMTSDGGTTWGCYIGGYDRTGTVNHGNEWLAMPADGSADVELVVIGQDGYATGRSWKWNVQGPSSVSGGAYWLSGLHALEGKDFPYGEIVLCTFTRTNRSPNADAVAQRAIDDLSRATYGLQDYRRLDLPFGREVQGAQAWAAEVLRVAASSTTYIGEAEVHVHQPEGPRGLQIDLLDRLTIRKQYPEYGNAVVRYVADVVGIDDEADKYTWIRRLHLAPVGAPIVEAA